MSLIYLPTLSLTAALYSHSLEMVEEWLTITWLAKTVDVLDAFTSLLLALLVIFYLQRSRTGFRKTESMINRLVLWSVNTGLLTSICAIFALIFVSIKSRRCT